MHAPNVLINPGTDLDREEVRIQLQKILESPAFHNSKRYAAVLKFIVDQTLEGNGARLKERTIGIEVFNRAPDYDTATDHAVRSAVAEVRKRLAQYYQENAAGELRIEVLPGSYMPQFRRAEESVALVATSSEPVPEIAEPAPAVSLAKPEERGLWRRFWLAGVAAAILLGGVITALVATMGSHDPLDSFWAPIFASRAPVLLCVGNVEGGQPSAGANPVLNPSLSLMGFHSAPSETILVYDAVTITKFAGLMQARGKQFQLTSQSDATFTDLQNGPAILVGLLNNNWTERIMPNLRFTAVRMGPTRVVMYDRNNPSNQDWSVDFATPYLDLTRDYAIILRMVDPKTEQVVVVAAGLTVFGTYAAGDFLTNKNEMRKLAAAAPAGWEKKNMEVVLATDVIRGRSGPATVIATQFW